MRQYSHAFPVVIGLCLGLATPALAAGASDDSGFLRSTARGSNYELAMARLAEQKATRPDVKAYARTIVTDHTQLNTALRKLTASKGVAWPTGLEHSDKTKLARLNAATGPDFDQAFVSAEAEVNKADKSDLEKIVGTTQDPDVKAFAKRMQADDAKHERMGKKLQG